MKKVIVTTSWDDGHVLDLKLAALLRKYSIKGTFYVSPQNREFEAAELLSGDQLLQISQDFEIGAHTLTHPRLSKVSLGESEKEIRGSKSYLENLLKKSVTSFCYPGGDYNQDHLRQVSDAGFKLARTVKRFSTSLGKNNLETPTTIHAYNHLSDIWKIARFARFNPFVFIRFYLNWNLLAKAMFDQTYNSGGIFHLWGHSWEIEKNGHWGALEDVLSHISNRKEVEYVTNGNLI